MVEGKDKSSTKNTGRAMRAIPWTCDKGRGPRREGDQEGVILTYHTSSGKEKSKEKSRVRVLHLRTTEMRTVAPSQRWM